MTRLESVILKFKEGDCEAEVQGRVYGGGEGSRDHDGDELLQGNSGKHPWYHQTHAGEVKQSHPGIITVELREAKLSWELYLCPGKRICYSG